MVRLVDQRRWLGADEEASMRYVIELHDGRRGEADTAITLFDLLCDPNYSDCEDRVSQIMELGKKLKDIAAFELAARGIRTQVYSGAGLFFDNGAINHPDDEEEEAAVKFENDEPVILDFWDEWTTIASMINCGYLRLFEKAHKLSASEQKEMIPTLGIFERMFGDPNTEDAKGYREVTPKVIAEEPTWKPKYILLADR